MPNRVQSGSRSKPLQGVRPDICRALALWPPPARPTSDWSPSERPPDDRIGRKTGFLCHPERTADNAPRLPKSRHSAFGHKRSLSRGRAMSVFHPFPPLAAEWQLSTHCGLYLPHAIRIIAINAEKPIIVHPLRRCNRSLFSRASPYIHTGIVWISFSDRVLVEGARKTTSEPNAIINAGKYKPSLANV